MSIACKRLSGPPLEAHVIAVECMDAQNGACVLPLVPEDAADDMGVGSTEGDYREEELTSMIDQVLRSGTLPAHSCFRIDF